MTNIVHPDTIGMEILVNIESPNPPLIGILTTRILLLQVVPLFKGKYLIGVPFENKHSAPGNGTRQSDFML